MSGQPYRYASDVENYRAEYMNSLGLRVNIDDMNYQANKNYLETGVLPARSQMKDTRATADILLDTEKLKLGIIKDFKPIAGPNMAMAIIQRVIASPLNGDGSFFVWLAQNTPELVMQLKKKYKLGIAGDENDVSTMVLFLQSLYSKTKDMNASVKSAFDRPTTTGTTITPRDYTGIKNAFDDIYLKLISARALTPLLKQIKDRFNAMDNIFNPPTRYTQVRDMYINMSTMLGVDNPAYMTVLNSGGYRMWVDYNEQLPSPTEVRALLSQLQKSELNADSTLSKRILTNLLSLLPSVEDSRQLVTVSDNILGVMGGAPTQAVNAVLATTPQPTPGALPATQAVAKTISDNIADIVLATLYDLYQDNKDNQSNMFQFGAPVIQAINDIQLTPAQKARINYTDASMKAGIDLLTQNNINTVGQLINDDDLATFQARERNTVLGFMRQQGMTGFGLKRRGRPRGSGLVKPITERIDKTKGIKQGCTQIPFGKYIINKNKLDNDIFYILDAKKGYCVKGYPQKKISSELSSVVKSIIGGSVPKFEDLQNLDNDDKEYLHKVASKAGVLDKLSIPAPSKDKKEKDIHQFEVMKGEILAGNDSTELIKKFKLLLLRLSKNGSIPKRETVEIMEDLISLGY